MHGQSQRIVFLDYLRVVACFMVILVHACEPFYLDGVGTYIANANDAFWVTAIDSALRCAVPLFVMTSSYLLFPVQGSTSDFFRRRLTKIVVPFIVWSVLYAVVPMWGCSEGFDRWGNLANLLLNFNMHSGHLWFIYMLIGVYIAMPIFSPWIERLSRRGEEVFLGVWFFTTLVPFLHQGALALFGRTEVYGEANWNEFGTLYYVSGFIGYVVLGHYIRTYIDWSWRKTLAIALPMWVVGYGVTTAWFWLQIPEQYPVKDSIDLAVLMEQSWRFCSTGVALTSIALFLIFKKFTYSKGIYRIVYSISRCSYGIYLMHMFALVAAHSFVSSWGLSTPATIFTTATITFVVSAIVSRLLSFVFKGRLIGY